MIKISVLEFMIKPKTLAVEGIANFGVRCHVIHSKSDSKEHAFYRKDLQNLLIPKQLILKLYLLLK